MKISQQLKKLDRPRRRDMTRNEKIVAHYVHGLKLSGEDEAHRQLLVEANRLLLAGKTRQFIVGYLLF